MGDTMALPATESWKLVPLSLSLAHCVFCGLFVIFCELASFTAAKEVANRITLGQIVESLSLPSIRVDD